MNNIGLFGYENGEIVIKADETRDQHEGQSRFDKSYESINVDYAEILRKKYEVDNDKYVFHI